MRISLGQIKVEFENKELNKTACIECIKDARKASSDFIIFPEMTLTGFSMNTDFIGENNSETIEWFRNTAIDYGIAIGFGHVVKKENKYENSFTIVDSKGDILLTYAKLHPFSYSLENKYYEKGNEILCTELKAFIVSPFICYDLRFPEIFQIASKEASLITVAANWPESRRDNWITLLKARAIENQCYIAAVNICGTADGLNYCGDSLIVDPIGNIIADASSKAQVVTAEILPEVVNRYRTNFPLKKDRREDLYKTKTAKRV